MLTFYALTTLLITVNYYEIWIWWKGYSSTDDKVGFKALVLLDDIYIEWRNFGALASKSWQLICASSVYPQ